MARKSSETEIELMPDAGERFERAIGTVSKSTPHSIARQRRKHEKTEAIQNSKTRLMLASLVGDEHG